MKKIFSILISLAAITLLASCQKELERTDVTSSKVILKEPAPGDMAEVTFTISIPGVSFLDTKALTDQPSIASGDIYLALFGIGDNETKGLGGNLQHFLKAKLTTSTSTDAPPISHDLTEVTGTGESAVTTTHKYAYQVLLPISDEPFVVDFLVGASDPNGNLYTLENPPAVDYEKDFMPKMLSRDGVPGYWQRVVIPKVEPLPKPDGSGYVPSSDGNDYKAKPIAAMNDIQLVRNFAKVTFTATSDALFTINKFVLIDYPRNGDIAPFDASPTIGYKTPYMGHNTDYASIVNNDYKYPGISTLKTLQTGIATSPTFTTAGEYSFLYERPVPGSDMPESGAIIEVTWKNVTDVAAALRGQTRYYKVAFTGESGSVPILRNIAYNFQIAGFKTQSDPTTPGAAYNGSWLGDISANVATANLDEIANSTSSIIVSEMSKTHIGNATTTPYEIFFQYYPNTVDYPTEVAVVNGTNFHGKNVKVVASIEPVSGYGAAISSITQPVADTSHEEGKTWGKVEVQTNGSGENVLRSKLKILGQLDGQIALYREVIFTVMEKQYFNNGTIDSSIDEVTDAINQQTTLHLRIPSDLPKDIFPLQVRIESQANNLTSIPVGSVEALPVKYGPSVFNSSKNSFYFIKTINWDDYAHLSDETYSYTTEFPCYFKTTLESGNNDTAISLLDMRTTSTGNVVLGTYFYEMILVNGIFVSPSSQTVNHDVTTAKVTMASGSAWTLGAHDGLTVTAVDGVAPTGTTISGEAGSHEITFSFAANNGNSRVTRTATFTADGESATATIVQTALVPVTRTFNTNSGTFNNNYDYTGEYSSVFGVSFTNGYYNDNNYLYLNRTGSTVTITGSKITKIIFTWRGNNYRPTNYTVVSGGGSTTLGTTTTWTNDDGPDTVAITFSRNNNYLELSNLSITTLEEQ